LLRRRKERQVGVMGAKITCIKIIDTIIHHIQSNYVYI
jgi:hypothetical protein